MSELSSETPPIEEVKKEWPEFPWLTILIQPRTTIRAIVDSDVNRYVPILVILAGFVRGLDAVTGDSRFSIWTGTISARGHKN